MLFLSNLPEVIFFVEIFFWKQCITSFIDVNPKMKFSWKIIITTDGINNEDLNYDRGSEYISKRKCRRTCYSVKPNWIRPV